jgi:hypothetical protein
MAAVLTCLSGLLDKPQVYGSANVLPRVSEPALIMPQKLLCDHHKEKR